MEYTIIITLSKDNENIEKEYSNIYAGESFESSEYIEPIYKRLHSNKLFNSILSVYPKENDSIIFNNFRNFCINLSELIESGYELSNIIIKDNKEGVYYNIDKKYIVDFDYETRLNQRNNNWFLECILLFYLIKEG